MRNIMHGDILITKIVRYSKNWARFSYIHLFVIKGGNRLSGSIPEEIANPIQMKVLNLGK